MRRGSLAALLLAGTAGGAVLAQAALAQEDLPARFTARVSERLTADSNYQLDDPSPGTSYYADTRLELGYLNQTPTQTFALGLDTGLRALWEADEPFDFTLASPTSADLDYANEWADGLFDANLRYRQRQVNTILDLDDEEPIGPGGDNLDQLQGDTREMRYDANIGVAWGTSSPSSYELRFLATHFDYSDDDTNRVPRTTLEGQAGWALQFDPVLAGTLDADYLHYEADNEDNTELNDAELVAGLLYTPSENFALGGGLGYSKRVRYDDDVTGDRETTQDNSGPSARANFRYVTPDLVLSGNARYTTAAPDPEFSGALRASYLLPRGRINGRLFQTYTASDTGNQQTRVTGIVVGLVRDINAVSSLGLDFAWAVQEDVEDVADLPGEPDIHRTNVTATYSYALTEQVSADVGYRFRQREEDPDNAVSHAVFIELGRSFATR
jgi:opacity protein-like surface antigen